jgi:hypothetical protein|tara:strand:- start:201 stop:665 length:465 start_codon:yes stop_codon:yes gene_type:complete
MKYIVRPPTLEDYPQINSLGQWFQQNSFYSQCGWSKDKSYYWVSTGAQPESSTFMRVVELDGKVVGFFMGNLTEYFFSTQTIAQDLVMVFTPEHRDGISKPIIKMLREFFNWAKKKKAHEICIGVTSGIAGPGYEKLILKHGFKKVGLIMKKEV